MNSLASAIALIAAMSAAPALAESPLEICGASFSRGIPLPTRVEACTTALAGNLSAENRAISFYNRGRVFSAMGGQSERAVADYDEVLRIDRGYTMAWANRGAEKLNLRRYAEAVADLDEAIRPDPSQAGFWLNRGGARAMNGDLEGGLDDLTESIRLDPNEALAYRNRALVRRTLGDDAGAAADEARAGSLAQ